MTSAQTTVSAEPSVQPSVDSLLQAWGGHVAVLTPTGRVTWVSPQWDATMREFGLFELTYGQDYWHALQSAVARNSDRVDALVHAIEQVRKCGQSQVALEMSWSTDSGYRQVRVDITALADGFVLLQIRDISPAGHTTSDLIFKAYHDPVTSLPNRFAAIASINQALRRTTRTDIGMGLVFCDLDDFKEINDKYGHRIGDELLRQTANRWREWTRGTDTLARLSGDEFVLVADGVSGGIELAGLAHRLAQALVQPMTTDGHAVRVSASFGAVFVDPRSAANVSDTTVLDTADQALYAAKRRGTNQLVVKVIGDEQSP